MNDKDRLAELFRTFPGIGPRQAKRMVYSLLSSDRQTIADLSRLIGSIQQNILICSLCFRYFEKRSYAPAPDAENTICSICSNPHRSKEILMIVSRDVDLEAIEKSGVYEGMYFVLGGVIPFLSKNPEEMVRVSDLLRIFRLRLQQGLKEVIFALNATPEGEHTTDIILARLKNSITDVGQEKTDSAYAEVGFSKLGRGFSTGTEVEYSDKETLKNAISSRFLS